SIVAIGNGTGCREAEQLVADLIADLANRRLNPSPEVQPAAATLPTDTPAAHVGTAPVESPAPMTTPGAPAGVTLDTGGAPVASEAVTLSTDLPATIPLVPPTADAGEGSPPAAPSPTGETLAGAPAPDGAAAVP